MRIQLGKERPRAWKLPCGQRGGSPTLPRRGTLVHPFTVGDKKKTITAMPKFSGGRPAPYLPTPWSPPRPAWVFSVSCAGHCTLGRVSVVVTASFCKKTMVASRRSSRGSGSGAEGERCFTRSGSDGDSTFPSLTVFPTPHGAAADQIGSVA